MANNVDLKYGEVTTEYGNFIDGEPVIVFRCRDEQLPNMLRHYRSLCQQAGSPTFHLELIENSLARVEEWQAQNLSEVIVPKSAHYQERVESDK